MPHTQTGTFYNDWTGKNCLFKAELGADGLVVGADGYVVAGEVECAARVVRTEFLGFVGPEPHMRNYALLVEGKSGVQVWIRYLENQFKVAW